MSLAFCPSPGVAYWYYQDTQKALRVYAENPGKLQGAIQTQQAANEALRTDLATGKPSLKN